MRFFTQLVKTTTLLSSFILFSNAAFATPPITIDLQVNQVKFPAQCQTDVQVKTLQLHYEPKHGLYQDHGMIRVRCEQPQPDFFYILSTDLIKESYLTFNNQQKTFLQFYVSDEPLPCQQPLAKYRPERLYTNKKLKAKPLNKTTSEIYYCLQMTNQTAIKTTQTIQGAISLTFTGNIPYQLHYNDDEWVDILRLNLEFKNNDATLPENATVEIAKLAQAINAMPPNTKVVIHGYASAIGKTNYNQQLSLKRANAIKHVLVRTHHIDEKRLITLGWGETRPTNLNRGKQAEANNRHAEVLIAKRRR